MPWTQLQLKALALRAKGVHTDAFGSMSPGEARSHMHEGLKRYAEGGVVGPWDNPQERLAFYRRQFPVAKAWEQKTGIPAAYFIAATANETNFGRNGPGFGIHGPSPTGASTVRGDTTAAGAPYQVPFATYQSDDDAYAHFINLISTAPRYQPAWQQFQRDRNPAALFQNITRAGYAEDQKWGGHIADFARQVTHELAGAGVDVGAPAAGAAQPQQSQASAPSYIFPVKDYQGKVELHWGEHKGATDIFAKPGTPVLAMRGGAVVSAGYSDVGGNNVTIQGDDGNVYYYAHLIDAPLVRQGQQVQAGMPLGGVGDTGNAKGTGAHLHIGIGPTISRGTGPAGGAGENFDAVTLLRQTLAGQAPTVAAGGGATAMVNQQQGSVDPTIQAELENARARIARMQAEQDRLLAAGATGENWAQLDQLGKALSQARQDYSTLLAAARQFTPSPLQTAQGIAGIVSQDFANRSSAAEQNIKIAAMYLQNELGMAGLAQGLLGMYEDSKQAAVNQEIAREGLNLQAVRAIEEAKAEQFTAALGQSAAVLAQQKFIDETRFRNFERQLPPGTTEVPLFGRNDPIGQALGRLGIAYQGMKATPVDWSQLDPATTYGEARGRVPELPAFSTAGIEDAAARIGGIQTYQPTQYGMADVGNPQGMTPAMAAGLQSQIPQAPDLSSYIAMLMGGGSGVPGVGAGAQPQAGYTNAQRSDIGAIERARRENPPGEEPPNSATTIQHGSPWSHAPEPQPGPQTQASATGQARLTPASSPYPGQDPMNPFDFLLRPRRRPAGATP
jgi:murein DD-endopeptidase MepM/ murein hydrolase activator NlpD